MSLPELCIRRPVMTTLLMMSFIIFGLFGYMKLPVAALPRVDFPTINISASLPGANPETMASSVAAPLERAFFLKTARRMVGEQRAASIGENDFVVVIPAFTVSELSSAFQIGFLIFLPFLVIDLVVGNVLLAMGMMMMSPVTVSLPFKLLLFVLIDGWVKLVHGLVLSYH